MTRPDAPLPSSATGVSDPTPSPTPQIEPSVYQLGAEFKKRSPLSIEAVRRDPAYRAILGMGEMGAIRILNYTTGHEPSWLETAVDEIAGQDISGLADPQASEGITLAEVHERTHAWGEAQSLIAVRDETKRQEMTMEVLEGLKGVYFQDPIIRAELGRIAPSSNERVGRFRARVLDARLEVDGAPTSLSYYVEYFSHGGGREGFSTTRLDGDGQKELDWTFFVSTFYKDGLSHGGHFDGRGTNGSTHADHRQLTDLIANPPGIKVVSATARTMR